MLTQVQNELDRYDQMCYGESPHGILAKVLDCDIIVSKGLPLGYIG